MGKSNVDHVGKSNVDHVGKSNVDHVTENSFDHVGKRTQLNSVNCTVMFMPGDKIFSMASSTIFVVVADQDPNNPHVFLDPKCFPLIRIQI